MAAAWTEEFETREVEEGTKKYSASTEPTFIMPSCVAELAEIHRSMTVV